MKAKIDGKTSARRNQIANTISPNEYSASLEENRSYDFETKSRGHKIREKIQIGANYFGNSIETFGKMLQKNGYNKLGSKVEKVGDKIEHMVDQNNKKKGA